MSGIIGRKVGMTSIFDADGKSVACTVIEATPNVVTQVRTDEVDGYSAIQLGYGDKKDKHTTRAEQGHFKKAGCTNKRKLVEFRSFDAASTLGQSVDVSIFSVGDVVEVVGTSKGKGFQGVVKRHGFSGVGGQTHGQHNRGRHPGSVGACSYPARVFKGTRMAGRTGNDRIKVLGLKVLQVLPESNLIVVSGSVPGAKNSIVILEK